MNGEGRAGREVGHKMRLSRVGATRLASCLGNSPVALAPYPPFPKPPHLPPPPHTHPPRFFLALSRQQQTAKEMDRARITAPLSSEAATAAREPVAEGCGAAAGQSRGAVSGAGGVT